MLYEDGYSCGCDSHTEPPLEASHASFLGPLQNPIDLTIC